MKKNRSITRHDRANAFLAEPETNEGPAPDDLAEYLGESFVSSATGGDDNDAALHDEIDIDELGGPFIETDAGVELAGSRDGEGEPAEPEPFPTALRSDRANPIIRHRH
jgi:hypothetical protein